MSSLRRLTTNRVGSSFPVRANHRSSHDEHDGDIVYSSALTLSAAIRGRQFSALDVLDAHLDWIESHNSELNAIVTLDAFGARERARAADDALARGEVWGPCTACLSH
jgi:hypothetical protein